MITARIPKGFRDFLPQKMALRKKIISQMSEVFELFGFEPLDTPCLEYAETLMGKYGDEGDKLIYRFADRGGRDVALRYDLTIPLSRVMAMHSQLVKPFKRYQIAPVWRADKPQKGRFREFYQCDVDIIGSESPRADAELLIITSNVLHRLGFDDYVIRINNRKLLNALARKIGLQDDQVASFLRSLDKLDKIGAEGVLDELQQKEMLAKQQLDMVNDRLLKDGVGYRDIKAFIAGDNIGDAGCLELDVIEQTLQAYGIPEKNYAIDITLARGLDYYTGPIFETIVKEPRIGSITGGGRYDNLIGLFSKNQLPATGTSFGLERIITVMEELGRDEQQAAATTVLIALFSNDMMPAVAQLAGSMRNAAISTEVYFEPAKLKKQFSYASSRNMPFVLVLGPDEAEKNLVTIKDMSSGAQETIPQGDAVTKLAGLMKS